MYVEAQSIHRVVRVAGEEFESRGFGSGFLIDVNGSQYLITAAHLLTGEREEVVTISHFAVKVPYVATLQRLDNPTSSVDIAIFELPRKFDIQHLTLPVGSMDLIASQDVYILGYPYGLSHQWSKDGLESPLMKRGIMSGGKFAENGSVVYVDTIANPGFSGGMALFENHRTKKQTVFGVVKGTLTQPSPDGKGTTPAGITVVTTIESGLVEAGIKLQ